MKRVNITHQRGSSQVIEPVDHRSLLGPPPIVGVGIETAGAYNGLYTRIRSAIKPKDVIDEILARDVTDLTWEVVRLRRHTAKLVKVRLVRGIEAIFRNIYSQEHAEKLARQWAAGDRQAIKRVDRHLASMGLDHEAVASEAMCADIRDFEIIDRLTMLAEQRRNNALREIERRRSGLGAALRRAGEDVVDAEFQDVPVAAVAPRAAS